MAVIEMQNEPRSIKAMLFVAALILGFVALGGVIYWLVKPAAPRTIKLTGAAATQATQTTEGAGGSGGAEGSSSPGFAPCEVATTSSSVDPTCDGAANSTGSLPR